MTSNVFVWFKFKKNSKKHFVFYENQENSICVHIPEVNILRNVLFQNEIPGLKNV